MGIKEDALGDRGSKALPINSKQKGNRNELEVCKWLSAWTGVEFVRVPMSGGLRWKNTIRMNICGDVVCTDYTFEFPFSIETKHYRSISFDTTSHRTLRKDSMVETLFEQCRRDAGRDGKFPMLMLRVNRMPKQEWVVVFDISHFSSSFAERYVLAYSYSRELILIKSSTLKLIGYHETATHLHRRELQ